MTPDLIPASGILLSDAFDRWWQRIRPTEAEALAWWESELGATAAAAMAAGDTDRLRGATEALGRFRRADAAERRLYAQRAALAQYSHAQAAFVAALAAGALTGRVMRADREYALPGSWWLDQEFMTACWHRPAIYLDRGEFEAWLSVATEPGRVRFADLVEWLRHRAAADPTRLPSETDDWAAAKLRFGARISRAEIRDARSVACPDRRNKPGRPRKPAT